MLGHHYRNKLNQEFTWRSRNDGDGCPRLSLPRGLKALLRGDKRKAGRPSSPASALERGSARLTGRADSRPALSFVSTSYQYMSGIFWKVLYSGNLYSGEWGAPKCQQSIGLGAGEDVLILVCFASGSVNWYKMWVYYLSFKTVHFIWSVNPHLQMYFRGTFRNTWTLRTLYSSKIQEVISMIINRKVMKNIVCLYNGN